MDRIVRGVDVCGLAAVHTIVWLYALFDEDLLVPDVASVLGVVGVV